jgi:hypothetical protein
MVRSFWAKKIDIDKGNVADHALNVDIQYGKIKKNWVET